MQAGGAVASFDDLKSWGYVGARNIFDGESYGKFSVDFDATVNSNEGNWEGQTADAGGLAIEDANYAGLVFFAEREDKQQRWPLFGLNQDDCLYTFKSYSTDFRQLFVEENKTDITIADSTSAHYKVDIEISGSDIIYTLYVNGTPVGDAITYATGVDPEVKPLYQAKSVFFALTNLTDEKIRTKSGLKNDAFIDNVSIRIPLGESNTSVKYNRGRKADKYFMFGYSDPHGYTAETAASVVCTETGIASTDVSVEVLDAYTIRVNHDPVNDFIGGSYMVTVGNDTFECGRNGLYDMTIATEGNKAALTYKNTGSALDGLLICAVYDNATGKLVDIKTKQGTLTAGAGVKGADMGALETAAVEVAEGQTLRTFLWNGITLKPIK